MKWRERINMKWRIESHINVSKSNPIEHLILCYLYRLLEWFVITMVVLLVLYEVLDSQWFGIIIALLGGTCIVMVLKTGAKSEHKAYKECLNARLQAYEMVKQEDSQALRKRTWLDCTNQGKAELKQKLNHKE